jgi:succinyl-CoA synthetase alpha subunit
MMEIRAEADQTGTWIIGPNSIGIVAPGECIIGTLGAGTATKGPVGIVARGGTIVVETIRILGDAGIGQSTCIGAGGDKVIGKNLSSYLEEFDRDPETKAVLLVGEVGGQKEYECAEIIRRMSKPVFFYLLGRTAPEGARMGHIGTIIAGESEGFEAKREMALNAGAILVDTPWHFVELIKQSGICAV